MRHYFTWNRRRGRWHKRHPSIPTPMLTIIHCSFFQHRKRSNQDYRRHRHFILSNITQHNLHPPYLAMAFPFPCFIKEELAGVWTRDPESLSQEHFTHGAACRLTHHSLLRKGGMWLNSKNRKIRGIFFPAFLERGTREGIGRNSGGFCRALD